MNPTILAHGRLTIDGFHERYFLFVASSTAIRLDRKTVLAGSLPETNAQLAADRFEDIRLSHQAAPAGFSSAPGARHTFRILRLLELAGSVIPEDLLHSIEGPGDPSRAVTISGHFATDDETGSDPLTVTRPSIVLEKLATFEAIQQRAFEIFQSGSGGSQDDHWFRAERELLGLARD